MTATLDRPDPIVPTPQLRRSALSQLESLGQSIANIAPTLTPALSVAVIVKLSGNGAWLAYLIATVGMMFVAANIGSLARRHPLSGSYFIYIGRTLGPFAGALAGWSIIGAYLVTAVAVSLSFIIFLNAVLAAIGLRAFSAPPILVLPAFVGLRAFSAPPILVLPAFVGLVGLAAYHDIKLSSRLALILEGLSLGVIALIVAIVVWRHGGAVDHRQFDWPKLPLGGVLASLAFAVFGFVGFESAATLSQETHDAPVAIPRAVMLSAVGAGAFFVVVTYFMVLGMGPDAPSLGSSDAPFADLTARAGLSGAAGVVYASALISSFACVLASLNAASRLLFSMGRYGFLHGGLGRVHSQRKTPHIALIFCAAVTLIGSLALLPLGVLDAYGLSGTFAALGFLVVYLLVCLAAPLDAWRSGGLGFSEAVTGALGLLAVGFVLVASVYPAPAKPYDLLPYLFAAYLALGAAWFVVVKRRSPQAFVSIADNLEV